MKMKRIMSAARVAAKLPWKDILKVTLTIAEAAGALYRTARKYSAADEGKEDPQLAKRISQLEEQAVEQARIVSEIAGQMKTLAETAEHLHRRVVMLTYAAVGLGVLVIVLGVLMLVFRAG